ncbi:ABC-type nitrate/sulfonate/bicarbonate transport system permease [Azorhizobium caulinodans ORS 571]|uniref:ABC-type nitrate/sulfonate/bicarbonate transport system permease n=1 Tax=Azorhizobium caulinodans (strain ATCC 43989 / DSM 5975 / JCM 20966 / LMG 6465 / NBRC 14845 / NCIMB 13405 / ORS 571) TaxID=438753 RepID=A8I2V6_AZOC5|nr:ABC transporter permease [Azorhizobium caulinodans]BAF87940.1 ABC-type nitrate/sulfonate/bicarbonate transport system permease [Azorhizobium caulinodans ORS 571]
MTAQPVAAAAPAPRAIPSEAEIEAKARARIKARRTLVITLRIAILVAVLGFWEIGAETGFIDPFFFASPSGIADQIWIWITEGTSQGPLWTQIVVTLEETVLGFIIGAVGGVVCGILLGRNKLLADVFSIYIKIANSIPRVVLGSIFIIALGLGMPSKVALAVVMVFFVVFANAFQGVREADRAMIANAQILGASPFKITTTVIIPSAMSWILASLHVSFGFALVGAVVGEFLGAKQGVGLLIATAQGAFNANGVFAAMIILAVLALVMEFLITLVENRLVKWRPVPFHEQN